MLKVQLVQVNDKRNTSSSNNAAEILAFLYSNMEAYSCVEKFNFLVDHNHLICKIRRKILYFVLLDYCIT